MIKKQIAIYMITALLNGEETMKKEEKFGMWPSPIQAEVVSQSVKRFGNIVFDGDQVYWDEMRPAEGGRTVIVSETGDVTPLEFSACSRVHEMGGKSFTVHKGVIYFVNDKDQRI